jgi:hypothetical protein
VTTLNSNGNQQYVDVLYLRCLAGGAAPVAGAPLAAGIDARPPYAFGRFVCDQPNVSDRSGNHFTVLSVPSEDISQIQRAIDHSAQFRRIGPTTAALLGVAVQPSYVKAFTIKALNSAPREIISFGQMS